MECFAYSMFSPHIYLNGRQRFAFQVCFKRKREWIGTREKGGNCQYALHYHICILHSQLWGITGIRNTGWCGFTYAWYYYQRLCKCVILCASNSCNCTSKSHYTVGYRFNSNRHSNRVIPVDRRNKHILALFTKRQNVWVQILWLEQRWRIPRFPWQIRNGRCLECACWYILHLWWTRSMVSCLDAHHCSSYRNWHPGLCTRAWSKMETHFRWLRFNSILCGLQHRYWQHNDASTFICWCRFDCIGLGIPNNAKVRRWWWNLWSAGRSTSSTSSNCSTNLFIG